MSGEVGKGLGGVDGNVAVGMTGGEREGWVFRDDVCKSSQLLSILCIQ